MSLKRKAKIQHLNSPKGSIQRQIHQDIRLNTQSRINKENSTQHFLLNKMQQKITKILIAYQKLEDQLKSKDQLIKELEKENSLLQQRLVDVSTQKSHFQAKSHPRNQLVQEHVVQRTFTPIDSRKELKLPSQQLNYRVTDFPSPAISVVRQHDGRNLNKMLKESRSLQNLNKTSIVYGKNEPSEISIRQADDEQNKIFSRRDENRFYREEAEQDKSFIDVLGKLKQKIKRFDEEEQAEHLKKASEKEKNQEPERTTTGLQKVKSSHTITRRQFSFMDKPQQAQTQTLKQIWNQRDEEIKRMDELFSQIDQRINVIQKQ